MRVMLRVRPEEGEMEPLIYVKGNTATLTPPVAGSEEGRSAAVETPRRRQSVATPSRSAKKPCVNVYYVFADFSVNWLVQADSTQQSQREIAHWCFSISNSSECPALQRCRHHAVTQLPCAAPNEAS